ncbi:MAG: glycerophosphodiester phosphodiesterase family protein [Oligosphaeraceae bacterium]
MKKHGILVLLLTAGLTFAATPSRETLIAHRGESADAPENTLAAYQLAAERGFGFECDIYLSADKRVFTFHDSNLKRTTGGVSDKRCHEVTWDELQNLDVAAWGRWKNSRFSPQRPALLEEVLALAQDGRFIYVEVKTGPAIVPYIRQIVEAQTNATPRNTLFISFSRNTCLELKKQLPDYRVFLLHGARTSVKKNGPPITADALLAKVRGTAINGVSVSYDPAVVTADFIRTFRDAGLEFHVWTIDSLDRALQAFERGAQTVTTNRAKALLDQYEARQRSKQP